MKKNCMNQLYDLIEKWVYFGKPPIKNLGTAYCELLICAYNDLNKRGCATTSWNPVCDILDRCGFVKTVDENDVTFIYFIPSNTKR